jgi:ATP-dependent Lon protease
MEGRKRVKDQLLRFDSTYSEVRFTYMNNLGVTRPVTTLEEDEYPQYYHKTIAEELDEHNLFGAGACVPAPGDDRVAGSLEISSLKEQHLSYQENQRGISFDTLFGPYLKGAAQVIITDPYIRLFYQIRNVMELLETMVKYKPKEDEVIVHLITVEDDFKGDQQQEYLEKIKESSRSVGINFTWEFDKSGSLHARHIVTDHGWKILLDRGLDIFQQYEMNDAFTFANRLQQIRPCKAFEVTFLLSDIQKVEI